ncbi:hypothetical protein TKK_0017008 [Trichogramma kaykai]
MPEFGRIECIFTDEKEVYFYCKLYKTAYLEESLNSYRIMPTLNYRFVKAEELCNPKPFRVRNSTNNGASDNIPYNTQKTAEPSSVIEEAFHILESEMDPWENTMRSRPSRYQPLPTNSFSTTELSPPTSTNPPQPVNSYPIYETQSINSFPSTNPSSSTSNYPPQQMHHYPSVYEPPSINPFPSTNPSSSTSNYPTQQMHHYPSVYEPPSINPFPSTNPSSSTSNHPPPQMHPHPSMPPTQTIESIFGFQKRKKTSSCRCTGADKDKANSILVDIETWLKPTKISDSFNNIVPVIDFFNTYKMSNGSIDHAICKRITEVMCEKWGSPYPAHCFKVKVGKELVEKYPFLGSEGDEKYIQGIQTKIPNEENKNIILEIMEKTRKHRIENDNSISWRSILTKYPHFMKYKGELKANNKKNKIIHQILNTDLIEFQDIAIEESNYPNKKTALPKIVSLKEGGKIASGQYKIDVATKMMLLDYDFMKAFDVFVKFFFVIGCPIPDSLIDMFEFIRLIFKMKQPKPVPDVIDNLYLEIFQ